MKDRIGLIGLGLVGSALTERFVKAGFDVIGHDIDKNKVKSLDEKLKEAADFPCEVAEKCSRIVLSLPNSHIVREVIEGENGIIHSAKAETVIIDTTTGDPVMTAELAERLLKHHIHYIDATIAGSSQQVRSGNVILMIGGDEDIINNQIDILKSITSDLFLMGVNGKGAETKLVVNLFIGLNRLVLAEGLSLALKAGINIDMLMEVLKAGPAYSRVMDIKGDKMIKRDFTPQGKLAQHLKDVGLILEMGDRFQAKLPLSKLNFEILTQAVKDGLGDEDN
ncbi:NAD-binding protein, partial [Candidatus Poribacteria bacterium]|nr:NAD-binding protein [Candidatus Poribacteria bacterium]